MAKAKKTKKSKKGKASEKDKKKKRKKSKKVKKINHNIDLRIAVKKDFLEVERVEKRKGKDIKVWKMRSGIPYWLYNTKGIIENKNYILDEDTDTEDFSIYLMNEQVLILTSLFD